MLDDTTLLIRFSRDRSPEAFAELVGRHLNFVYSTALRQLAGDTHLAEDVSQSVFTDLARKAGSLVDCPVLARWLYRSTHHAAAKAVRSEQRRRGREQVAQIMHELSNDPARDAEWARIRPLLDEALRGLSKRDSDAILLRFFEGQSFAAIGAKLSLRENAARMRVDRALDQLHRALAQRGINSTAAALAALLSGEVATAAPAGLAAAIAHTAIVSSAGSGGAAAAFLHVMSTTKLSIGLTALFAAATLGFGLHEFHAAHEAEAEMLEARSQAELEFRQLQALRGQAAQAEKQTRELAQAIAGARALRAASGKTGSDSHVNAKTPPATPTQHAANRPLNTDPRVKAAMALFTRGRLANGFGPFFSSAGFSPEQREQMLSLLAEQWGRQSINDVTVSLRPDSVTEEEVSQEIQTLLGTPSAQQAFQAYQRTMDVRQLTTALAGNLSSTNAPLTAEQGEQLTRILADTTPPGEPASLHAVEWDAALAQAQTVLSAPQLAVLRNEAALIFPGEGFDGIAPGTFGGGAGGPPSSIWSPTTAAQ